MFKADAMNEEGRRTRERQLYYYGSCLYYSSCSIKHAYIWRDQTCIHRERLNIHS